MAQIYHLHHTARVVGRTGLGFGPNYEKRLGPN